MPKSVEKILLLSVDLLMINVAFFGLLSLRSSFNLFVGQEFLFRLQISMLLYSFWLLIFIFSGLYQSWYTQSRFDEIISVFKAIGFGVLLIFVLTFEPERDLSQPPTLGRMMILSYWLLMMLCVGGGRLILHTIQRKLLEAGVGQRNTLIIGWNDKSRALADKIGHYPALGYCVIGFIGLNINDVGQKHQNLPVLGTMFDLEKIIQQQQIEEVIISLGATPAKKVLRVISDCQTLPVQLKIEPDLYQIVLGHARTNQIYGFPLIEINPMFMPAWERQVKRLMDLSVAALTLTLLLPVFVLTAFLIKIDSPGPIFFKQKRVGRNGKIFTIYKFRSMVKDAERMTGPVWAGKRDPRITRVGRIMRKLRIDEFPQLINVLYGEMSLIGPRPERPYFVDRLKRRYPFYMRRFKVKPGITGWAQVKGKYDTTIAAAEEKLEYDLYYIDNMSLRLDFRIMLFTLYVMLRFKGQ